MGSCVTPLSLIIDMFTGSMQLYYAINNSRDNRIKACSSLLALMWLLYLCLQPPLNPKVRLSLGGLQESLFE